MRLLLANDQTASRLRPRCRRAAITLRPPTVLMRLRKPCVLALFRRFGWYVRFIKLLYERSGCLEQPNEYIRSLVSHPASKSHYEVSAITPLRRESKQESPAKQDLSSALDTLWTIVLVRSIVLVWCVLRREGKLSKQLSTIVDNSVDNCVNHLQTHYLFANAIALWWGVS